MTPKADFVLRNAGVLATMAGPAPRLGAALKDAGLRHDAALAAARGRIVWVGPDSELGSSVAVAPDAQVLDAGGAAVVPGFVDAHTHVAFAGDRDDEVRLRLLGATYSEIAAGGGGILRTVQATREAPPEALAQLIRERLDEMLSLGTTTTEVKSGYGLETAAELRILEAVREAGRGHPMTVVPTFLGAHEVPIEHRSDRRAYLRLLAQEMIPTVARLGLASFCDVFCEKGVFSVEESRAVLTAARAHGLPLRVHADELSASGGAELAAELRARSADHLVHVTAEGIRALAGAGCVAVLLPAAAFYLRLGRFAPARALVDGNVAIALGTDANPGGGLSPSMPFAMAVACFGMGLALEEALAAATVNAAFSLDLQDEVGSLEVGKRADLVLLRSGRLLDLLRAGVPAVATVVKDGRIVAEDGRRVPPAAARR